MTDLFTLFDLRFIDFVEDVDFPDYSWRLVMEGNVENEEKLLAKSVECGFAPEDVKERLCEFRNLPDETFIESFKSLEYASHLAVAALQSRLSEALKAEMLSLAHSKNPDERRLAIRVLRPLTENVDESIIDELYTVLESESDERVLIALCHSLAFTTSHEKGKLFIPLADHENEDVRFALAQCVFGGTSKAAIKIALKLAGDKDVDVRNWAVSGLRSALEHADNPRRSNSIFAPLFLRSLSDEDRFTRIEAIIGLSNFATQYQVAYDLLCDELQEEFVPSLLLEAAELYPTEKVLDLLEKAIEHKPGKDYDDLQAADIQNSIERIKRKLSGL